MGMNPPEGRGQPFNGRELLKGDTRSTEPCSHIYNFPTASDSVINMELNVMQSILHILCNSN